MSPNVCNWNMKGWRNNLKTGKPRTEDRHRKEQVEKEEGKGLLDLFSRSQQKAPSDGEISEQRECVILL